MKIEIDFERLRKEIFEQFLIWSKNCTGLSLLILKRNKILSLYYSLAFKFHFNINILKDMCFVAVRTEMSASETNETQSRHLQVQLMLNWIIHELRY